MPSLFVANWALMLLLSRVSVSRSYFLCSCVRKICEVQSLGSWRRDRYQALWLCQSAPPHWLFWRYNHLNLRVARKVTTLLSHQRPQKIFNKSRILKNICETITLIIANSVYLWFRSAISLKSKSDLSYHFLLSTRFAHRSDEPLDQCWLLI